MENCQYIASFDPYIKTEVKFEINLEEHELEELKPTIDIKFEAYQQEEIEALTQNEKIEIKSEENDENR